MKALKMSLLAWSLAFAVGAIALSIMPSGVSSQGGRGSGEEGAGGQVGGA